MSILWRDEMAVDHGLIDHDHQALIQIINSFCDAAPTDDALPELQSILNKLQRYTMEHFGREEALQREVQYAYREAHHHEHLDLIRELTDIRDRLNHLTEPPAGAPAGSAAIAPPGSVAAFHAEMAAFLRRWLIEHILKSDLRMKPYAAKLKEHTARMNALGQSGGARRLSA